MTEHHYEECEKCAEHKAWEERMKLLDNIPTILTWINQSKGGLKVLYWVCGLGLPFIIAGVVGIRAELNDKINTNEAAMEKQYDRLSCEVKSISASAAKISGDVQTLVETSKLINIAHDREIADMYERIADMYERIASVNGNSKAKSN